MTCPPPTAARKVRRTCERCKATSRRACTKNAHFYVTQEDSSASASSFPPSAMDKAVKTCRRQAERRSLADSGKPRSTTSSTFARSGRLRTEPELGIANGALQRELSSGAPDEILMGTAIIGKFGASERLKGRV